MITSNGQCVDMYAIACTKSPAIMTITDNDFPRFKKYPKNESIPSIQIPAARCTQSLFPVLNEPRLFAIRFYLPSFFRSISFSRIASMINSERLRYPKSERFRIVSSITPISSSGIETVVYPRDIFPLYICDKLGFLSDEHGMYHNHYKYGRYM